ncbi:MAG: hypothetical protein AB3N18_06390 [Allomuricauda sp.]
MLIDIDRNACYSGIVEHVPSKCPECGNLMANMGLDFESPKKSDSKAWSHMQNLYESGITYHSCGCSGPGYIPKDKEKIVAFLNERKSEYIEHRRFWSNRIQTQNESKKNKDWSKNSRFLFALPKNKVNNVEAVKYWAEKIHELENRLEKLK